MSTRTLSLRTVLLIGLLTGTLSAQDVTPAAARNATGSDNRDRRLAENASEETLSRVVGTFNRLIENRKFDEARAIVKKLSDIAPNDPIVKLMQSQLKWHSESEAGQGDLVVRTYAVADLVVPIPQLVDLSHLAPPHRAANILRASHRTASRAKPVYRFEPLMQKLRDEIEPESWDVNGGEGRITPYTGNLSLIVAQTPGIHLRIAELLTEIRASLDVQISVDLRTIVFEGEPTEKLKGLRDGTIAVSDRMRDRIREAAGPDGVTQTVLQKPTLFQNQTMRVSLGPWVDGGTGNGFSLLMRLVATPDGTGTTLVVAPNRLSGEAVFVGTKYYRIPSEQMVLIDLEAVRQRAKADLSTLPIVHANTSGSGRYLVVTPRVIRSDVNDDAGPQPYTRGRGERSTTEPKPLPKAKPLSRPLGEPDPLPVAEPEPVPAPEPMPLPTVQVTPVEPTTPQAAPLLPPLPPTTDLPLLPEPKPAPMIATPPKAEREPPALPLE